MGKHFYSELLICVRQQWNVNTTCISSMYPILSIWRWTGSLGAVPPICGNLVLKNVPLN